MPLQDDSWGAVVSMVTSTQKFNWLRQRLTGSKTEMPLVNKIIEFVMYESPIDIEKLRRSLHHQVSLLGSFIISHKHLQNWCIGCFFGG